VGLNVEAIGSKSYSAFTCKNDIKFA